MLRKQLRHKTSKIYSSSPTASIYISRLSSYKVDLVPESKKNRLRNMTNSAIKPLTVLFFFLAVSLRGTNGEPCGTSSIQVQTINTSATAAGGDTVFEVQVKNLCPCSVRNVRVDGGGFATTVQVDQTVFRPVDDGVYLVNAGEPIPSMGAVSFRYAWDHFFQMTPRSLDVEGQC